MLAHTAGEAPLTANIPAAVAPSKSTSLLAEQVPEQVGTARVDAENIPSPAELSDAAAAPPSIRTEGQRLLLAVPGSLELIGDSIGATKQAVSLWRAGHRAPGPQWRRAMHERLGIPPEAWARTPLPDGWTPSAPTRFTDPLDDAAPEPSPLDDVRRLLRSLREQLEQPNLLARERAQLSDAFAKALAQRERLEQARAMSEPRTIAEHPGWRRLRDAIIGALARHPDAMRDVGAAIQRELGNDEREGT